MDVPPLARVSVAKLRAGYVSTTSSIVSCEQRTIHEPLRQTTFLYRAVAFPAKLVLAKEPRNGPILCRASSRGGAPWSRPRLSIARAILTQTEHPTWLPSAAHRLARALNASHQMLYRQVRDMSVQLVIVEKSRRERYVRNAPALPTVVMACLALKRLGPLEERLHAVGRVVMGSSARDVRPIPLLRVSRGRRGLSTC
jgi:hypothetical protein